MPNVAARRLPKEMRGILKNQLDALADGADSAWRRRLGEEIESMRSGSDWLPWHGGLPAAVAASLEPYRDRLESTYLAEANPLELGRNQREGRWSIQAD